MDGLDNYHLCATSINGGVHTYSEEHLCFDSTQHPQMVVSAPTQKNTCALSPHNIHKWHEPIPVQMTAWASSLYNIHNWRCTYTCSKTGLGVTSIQYPQLEVYIYLFKRQPGYRCHTISTNDEVPIPLQRTTQIPLSYNIHK